MKYAISCILILTSVFTNAQIVNIPNQQFKNQVLQDYDTNGDHELQISEALVIRELYIRCYLQISGSEFMSFGVSDITGVETFANLERLTVESGCNDGGGLVNANLDGLSNLRYLNIQGDKELRKVNLAGCTSLDSIIITGRDFFVPGILYAGCYLIMLNLNSCINLKYVHLYNLTDFEKLLLDSCVNLRELYLASMSGDSLNIGNLRGLEYFGCTDAYNHINLNCNNLARLKHISVLTGFITDLQFERLYKCGGYSNLSRKLSSEHTRP